MCVCVCSAGGDTCSEKGQIIEMVTWSLNVPKKALKQFLRSFECVDVFFQSGRRNLFS